MRIVYKGEAPSRDLVIPGGLLTIEYGVPFEVDAELGASLLEQDIFEKAPAKKASE